MTRAIPESHPLHRMFRGLTESTFMSELGIGDPRLVGYVADLLARFVPTQEIWKIKDADGRRLTRVADMVAEAETARDPDRWRECHRHVGDYTLYWTGLYPEAVDLFRSPRASSSDELVDFQQQGKRSYYLAGTVESEESPVLRRLSHEFELCAFGLSRIRKEWERVDPNAPKKPIWTADRA